MTPENTFHGIVKQLTDSEYQSKIVDLFTFFCNHVYLGQWELARTAISSLCTSRGDDDRTNFINILTNLAECPFSQSLGSLTVPSAHHLSWLCLQELRDLLPESEKHWIDHLTKDVDFRLTLFYWKDVEDDIIQELYRFFQRTVLKISTTHGETPNVSLSANTLNAIKKILVTSPSLGDSIVRSLMGIKESSEKKINEILQGLYIECMNYLLDKIKDADISLRESLWEKLFEILSFYDPVPYWNYLQLRQLFSRLLSMAREYHIASERIVSVLIGRTSPYLLGEFCQIFHETSFTNIRLPLEKASSLNDSQRISLQILTNLDRDVCWREFSILCNKKRVHFLAEVLDLSLSLIKAGQFMELRDMLSFPELQPMKPAALLMGWSHCLHSTDARTLLDSLWDGSDDNQCPVLSASCRKLAYNLDLIQWCIDRAKPLLSNPELSQSHQASLLFQGLETYSVLYMLHHYTSFASLDHAEVLELLSHVTTDKSKEMKRKTVTFQDESKFSLSEPINIEQQKDLAVYRSFCAIKNVMDALVFCFSNFEHKLMNPVHIKRLVKTKRLDQHFLSDHQVSSSEGEDSSSPFLRLLKQPIEGDGTKLSSETSETFIQLYHETVTKKLRETRNHLAQLQPLTYRLEVLENIFSLLFVTHEDLQDVLDLETDDENDDIKKSSFENLDSLNISLFSDEEPAPKVSPPKISKSVEETVKSFPLPKTSSSLDYDIPFVDSNSQPAYDTLPESSYFTLEFEHLKKAEQYNQKISPENTILSKKKRKRRRSNSESSPNLLLGFLANEYLVRDLLHLLKTALADMNAAKFSIQSKLSTVSSKELNRPSKQRLVDPALEAALQGSLKTSIQPEQLVQRTTKLTQAIHEAWWRFQLVAHDAIPREAGHILPERVIVTDSDIHFLPACDGQVFATDKEVSSTEESRGRSMSTYTMVSQSNIISQMMASPESLLVHSLIKGNPSQAAEVIKLFQLSDKTSECCEVTFSDLYHSSSSKIWNLETESRDVKQHPPKLGKRSVKALSKAASVGVATASLSNIVEELLSKPCLPPTPKPKSPGCRETFSQIFNVDSCSAVLFDLLCTSCHSWESCSNMLDIIKTRSKFLEHNPSQPPSSVHDLSDSPEPSSDLAESSSSSSSPKSGKIVTVPGSKQLTLGVRNCHQFIWNLYDLIHMGDHQASRGHHLVTQSLQHHFHSAYSSFEVRKMRSLNISVFEIRRAVDHVQQTLTGTIQGQQMDIAVEDQGSSPSLSSRGSMSSVSGSTTESNTSVTKVTTKHQKEENSLHVSFKYLMYIMEKHAPGAGFTQLLHNKNSSEFKNYLLSLYKHVKEMSHLVAETQDGVKDVQKNYFKVLEEGPISILGRLMFVKKMAPARLEAVAGKLSLKLTHTIVYSCCPKIPSKHPPLKAVTDSSVQINSSRVYNVSQQDATLTKDDVSNPEELVQKLLSDFISVMEDISRQQSANSVFDISCARYLVQQTTFTQLTEAVQCLQHCDLTLLRCNEEKLCFFINLTNLMLIHCHLFNVKARYECPSEEESLDLFPLAAADYLIYLSRFSYQIGQLGVVSVFDLLTIIGHDELQPSAQWENLLASRNFVLSPDDPWKKFAPLPEPRKLFAINTGCISSPPLRVLKPSTVMSQIELAMKEYLSHTVIVSAEKEKVCVPELLLWSEKQFIDKSRKENSISLLTWLLEYISAEKQTQLQQLLKLESSQSEPIDTDTKELPFQWEVDYFDNSFSFTFDIHHVKTGQIEPILPKKRKMSLYPFTNSYEKSGQGWSLQLPVYNLTPVTLEYVKQDSLLVATMVSLVCADNLDNIEQQFTDDHFNQPETSGHYNEHLIRMHRSSSDISLVDIRSYRYQRLTDDYPILQRHLLHYILPLAGAENSELLESREPILKFVTNDIGDQVKLCMFSLPNSVQFQCVIQDMANQLLEDQKWTETLNILRSLPSSVVSDHIHLQILHDFVLSCWAIAQCKTTSQLVKVADGLKKFYNPFIQARTLLTICDLLPIAVSKDLLDLCLNQLDQKSGLWLAVYNKFQLYSLYCKIYDCAQRLLPEATDSTLNCSDQQLSKTLDALTASPQISTYCCDNPVDILKVLEKAGDFVSATAWAELQSLDLEIVRSIKQSHVHYLLTLESPDTLTAFQLLDTLLNTSPAECLSVCQTLIGSLVQPREIKFVLSFMLRYLSNLLPSVDLEDLMLRRIGAKALMCLPSRLQAEYNHLISCPRLILEQLLMNMKVELAGQIFEEIKSDFNEIKELKLRVTQEEFNGLLVTYANKAIQVNVVQVTTESARSQSSNSSSSAGPDDLNITQRYIAENVSPTGSFMNRQEVVSKVSRRQSVLLARDKQTFVMPSQPPTQDQWMPDSAASVCTVCMVERFSMFNRRHHCRRCGRVVCATCSTKQTLVFGVMARTCDDCWHQINSDHRSYDEQEIYSHRIKDRISGVSSSPSSMVSSPAASSLINTLQTSDKLKQSLLSAIHHVDHAWKLRPDLTYSQLVRSEFYYEQAPSVALCVSLLKQYSSKQEAGKLILQICDHLSTYLVPASPGVPNPEIDYSLIISVMKQLVFHAKLDFVESHDADLMDQSDLYMARIDLLQVMVEANYQDLPTIRELTKQDSVRRLRDKLITDERLNLAMEVSMKCGIDPAGVWAAMGFACFHLGDFQGARDKFSHCLKPIPDKNQGSPSQSRLLGEILDFLDTIPSSGVTELQRLLSSPSSICNIQTLLVPSKGEENRVESVPYKECLYYLRTYGSYMDHITFLRQHSYWMKAVQFAVDHQCAPDVFVNGLMIPAMNSGEMGRLLEQMLMLDPTLDKWTGYLTATCKYLLKQKYFSTLYHIQLFMKDYIRASMTCVSHFYQKSATSYLDLFGRMQFLYTAQQHLQAYLDPSQWGSVPHPLAPRTPSKVQSPSWDKFNPESAARMTLTPDQVNRHIRTINLQIEVTKFLEQSLTLGTSAAVFSAKSQVPTLFGQSSARTDLVSLIILSGMDFRVRFNLAVKIVRECRLNPTLLFTQCSRELAKQSRFSEITNLTQALVHEGMVDDEGIDEIIGASLLVLADSHAEDRDQSEALIQMLRSDSNKINALILCGKLRSAYLLAVKRESVEDVQRIAGAAQRLGQSAVKNICMKWLEQHQK
ncbi:zinc finger FYVE domain-containing protein 26 [Biomphalaria glabrata]|nr:zinc finger FYVE domain-containing protein 26 [Biomphalaria glabrata]